ncbi:nucleoside recognition domain-containing protein [Fusobacterium sp.]|uniref:nucleoside recognition domain-containing protein n=1 Tax=Fusobacterium sp. TaxID=68766 RepID=UPI001D82D40D|nr:nucleoside recognition domain-containing protein [Fusobacterium sp.]MBS5789555.1 nucleoside recognition protein [Fusobacterium sp.]MEE1475543.1 nucleoside recognition domain-containing protein [Fusobacterium sp.]
MINYIWCGMIIIGIIVGTLTGNIEAVSTAAIEWAETAVELSLGLIGVMALWLGLMKIAEEAGIVRGMGLLVKPIMVRLFPEVPADHPAMGSIVANMAANFFGLGNAATPLGIKAMQELQDLNENKEEASNAMVMFLAINTSSVTLISSSTIAYRSAAGAANPADIIAPTIVATVVSTTVAIVACKLLEKLPKYKREKVTTTKEETK